MDTNKRDFINARTAVERIALTHASDAYLAASDAFDRARADYDQAGAKWSAANERAIAEWDAQHPHTEAV